MSPLTELARKSGGHLILSPDYEPALTRTETFSPAEYVASLQTEIGRLAGVIHNQQEKLDHDDEQILSLTGDLTSARTEVAFLKHRYER